MKILLFAGSLRADSLNKKLVAIAKNILAQKASLQVTSVDLKTLSIPVYDGDIEALGIPEGVKLLGQLIAEADALVLSSPEYNGSIAGSFKNTIDWISRLRPQPLSQRPVLLMGASPGYFGAVRALSEARTPFNTLGAYLFPQTFALPKAAEAITSTGELQDEATKKNLETLLSDFQIFSEKFAKK
jgi:chromate reductase